MNTLNTNSQPNARDDQSPVRSEQNRLNLKPIHLVGLFALLSAAALWAYAQSTQMIYTAWVSWEGFHSHGFLALGMTALLLWEARGALTGPANRGLEAAFWWLWTAGAAAVWLLAWGTDYRPGEVMGLFGLLLGSGCVLFGSGSARTFGLRFALLAFSLPMWFNLNPVLQAIAAAVVEYSLALFNMTVYVEGNLVHIPEGVFEIAGSCSGLGFLLATLTLVTYVTLTSVISPRTTVLVFVLAVGLALLSNWIRIIAIILVGYNYGMDHELVGDHMWFGWGVYGVLHMPAMYLLLKRLPQKPRPVSGEPLQAYARSPLSLGLLLIIVLAAPLYVKYLGYQQAGVNEPAEAVRFARLSGDNSSYGLSALQDWRPRVEDADHQALQQLNSSRGEAALYYAGYNRQPESQQVINFAPQLLQDWSVAASNNRPQGAPFNQWLLYNQYGERVAVRYWYNIGGRQVISRLQAKLTRLVKKLQGRPDSYLVALAVPCAPELDETTCWGQLQQAYQQLSE